MSASKKRRKLPDEDLAAAVADIINSPITRPNLSFLRPLPISPPEHVSELSGNTRDVEAHDFDSNALGSGPKPLGNSRIPGGLDTVSATPDQPDSEKVGEVLTSTGVNDSQTTRNQFVSNAGAPKPRPPGFGPWPAGLELSPKGSENRAIPGSAPKSATQQIHSAELSPWEPQVSKRALWQAEGLTTLFEQSRVRRIRQAQDALSLVEEKVYDLLWGTKNQQKDEFRLVHYSLQRVANEARINIKTVRELIPRLIDKGFLRIEHEADVRRNIPTLYRVFSYSSVLCRQRQRQRLYVVKTGKGVFYVHPVSAALQARPSGPLEELPHDSFESRPLGPDSIAGGINPTGFSEWPAGLNAEPSGPDNTAPVGASASKPMGASGPLSIDNLEDRYLRQTSSSCWVKLASSIREWLGAEADNQLLRGMISACHRNAIETTGQPATEGELIYFTANKASILSRAPNIRNHMAVLRKAVPECFLGETFRAYREATAAQREKQSQEEQEQQKHQAQLERSMQEEQARGRLWSAVSERYRNEMGYDMQAIINDPDLDEQGREQARGMMQRLGRFTRSGI